MKICEIFHSIQGEGITMGIPTTFIRTSGCNLECRWCDTAYARDEGREMTLDQIFEEVEKLGCGQVCITGGEPMCQDETVKLIDLLLEMGYYVTLETNGSVSLEKLVCNEAFMISMDIKCPASGQSGTSRPNGPVEIYNFGPRGLRLRQENNQRLYAGLSHCHDAGLGLRNWKNNRMGPEAQARSKGIAPVA
jgi:pyruvate-formate lyase-activating enzyme